MCVMRLDEYSPGHWAASFRPSFPIHRMRTMRLVNHVSLSLFISCQVNNILIVNLAVSDLLLCTVVSPMTLSEIVYKRWPFGPHSQAACQLLSGMLPVCVALVSTLTITGIAIDR